MNPVTPLLERLAKPLPVGAIASALNPLWGDGPRGRIEHIVPANAEGSAAEVTIRTNRHWRTHTPGQFVSVGVDVDGVRHHRCYTLTSVPTGPGGLISIVVQAQPDGTVSPHLAHRARPGDLVTIGLPAGDIEIPSGDRLFVTAGSGITPAIAALRQNGSAGGASDTVVLHHARTSARSIHTAELERSARSRHVRIDTRLTSEPHDADRSDLEGIDVDDLDRRCPDWRDRTTVVCGPEPMIARCIEIWSDEGLADRLRVERFASGPPGSAPPLADGVHRATDGGMVRFELSSVDAIAGPGTILEIAERHGLRPATGCRRGVCHTCTTQVLSGETIDCRDGRVTTAGGHAQICVALPAGDVAVAL